MVKECTIKKNGGETVKEAVCNVNDTGREEKAVSNKRRALPELLAPAGSPKALRAAVNAGADAVYFALPDFNARINADNFTRESFAEGVKYCHSHGVRAYITLNTQVYDREQEDFLRSAEYAYRSGVDAAIVGDLGCAALLREHIPSLELHASTQLSAHNTAAAEELKKLGFTRVVLARELSAEDIESFTSHSELEAEIFIHGALCVCHSGQCLFSSLVGGRSGNRGLCAQPCRLPYKNPKGNEYPLSLKDACLAMHVPRIIEMGVASLKIEGRMKPAEYVYGVTSIYRRLLDEGRAATCEEMNELRAIFSRGGFTDGYFTDNISKKMLGVRSEKDKESSRGVETDTEKNLRRIGVDVSVAIRRNEPMRLTLSLSESAARRLGGDIKVEAEGEIPFEAKNRPTDKETAGKNLLKFGETPFEAASFEADIDDGLMVPVSALNSLRRKASEALIDAMDEPYKSRAAFRLGEIKVAVDDSVASRFKKGECDAENNPMRRTAQFVKCHRIPDGADEYFDIIFLSATEFYKENLPEIIAKGVSGIVIPTVVFDSDEAKLRGYLESAASVGIKYALVGNLGHLGLVREYGFVPIGGHGLNVSSGKTAETVMGNCGISRVILSPELTLPRARDIARRLPSALIVYGRIPLMTLEKCLISELTPCAYAQKRGEECLTCKRDEARLTDRTGASFPVLREFDHRNVVYNSLPTYVADRQQELLPESVLTRHFIFTTESAEETLRVIEAYKKGSAAEYPVRRLGVQS